MHSRRNQGTRFSLERKQMNYQLSPTMAYQRSNRNGQAEWSAGSVDDRNHMDVLIHIRASPSQFQELFHGSPGSVYGTTRSIGGNNCSVCEPYYYKSPGKQLRELESDSRYPKRDPEMRKAHKKNSSGGCCCIIFSPLIKLLDCLSLVLTCCS